MSHFFSRLFPTPSFFTIPTVGMDFSDTTMRFIKLKEDRKGIVPIQFSEAALPEGCLVNGRIMSQEKFTAFLQMIRTTYRLKYVRVAIPESQVYSCTLSIDSAAAQDIRAAIELVIEDNIPLKVSETVFDYQVLSSTATTIVVQVVAVAEAVAQSYCDAFLAADLVPVSFELDGQAVARALVPPGSPESYMIVDFGANRTGITIVTNGTAVYASSLEFGGSSLITALTKELQCSVEEAHRIKREYGLSAVGAHKDIFDILVPGISILKDEIHKRYLYWHEKKNQFGTFPAITTVYLCGGYGNLRGLPDYLSTALKLTVVEANPWVNCLSFNHTIPLLPAEEAISYITAIGIALADYRYD